MTGGPVPFALANVGDVASSGVINCAPETPLRIVARMMTTFNVHAVFVFEQVDEGAREPELLGLVSDLDVVAAGAADVDMRTAGGSAVTPLVTIHADAPLAEAARLMAENGIHHLAVIDRESRRPTGVISTLDVLRSIAVENGVRETHASA